MKKFLFFVILVLFTVGIFNITSAQNTDPNNIPQAQTVEKTTFKAGSYELISPIGNLTEVKDQSENGFSDFVNLIIRIAIALAGAVAVLTIIAAGIQYMGSDSVWEKGESKSRMTTAIGGLILLFCSYLILYTINPDLVKIKIGGMKLDEGDWAEFNPAVEYRLSKEPVGNFTRSKYYDNIKTAAAKYTAPHCIAQVVIQRESRGISGLIGHDENAPLPNSIKARREFVSSGQKYSGEKFNSGDTTLGTKGSFLNNDHITGDIYSASNSSKADLGLDWRFSHGIGLMQFTFFPKNNTYVCRTTALTKTSMCPKDMYDPNKAIQAGVELLEYNFKKCKGDVENTFKAYGSGNCTTTNKFAVSESKKRKGLYDACVAQDK